MGSERSSVSIPGTNKPGTVPLLLKSRDSRRFPSSKQAGDRYIRAAIEPMLPERRQLASLFQDAMLEQPLWSNALHSCGWCWRRHRSEATAVPGLEVLLWIFICLAIVAVVGHGIWAGLAWLFRLGTKPATRPCVFCGHPVSAALGQCTWCYRELDSPQAKALQDLAAVERQLHRFRARARSSRNTSEAVLEQVEASRRLLRPSLPIGNAETPIVPEWIVESPPAAPKANGPGRCAEQTQLVGDGGREFASRGFSPSGCGDPLGGDRPSRAPCRRRGPPGRRPGRLHGRAEHPLGRTRRRAADGLLVRGAGRQHLGPAAQDPLFPVHHLRDRLRRGVSGRTLHPLPLEVAGHQQRAAHRRHAADAARLRGDGGIFPECLDADGGDLGVGFLGPLPLAGEPDRPGVDASGERGCCRWPCWATRPCFS